MEERWDMQLQYHMIVSWCNAIPQELKIIQTMKLGEKEKNSLTDFESIIQQHFDFLIGLESPVRK